MQADTGGLSHELSPSAWEKILQRLGQKAGFDVSGFKYAGDAVIEPVEDVQGHSERLQVEEEKVRLYDSDTRCVLSFLLHNVYCA